MISTRVHGVLDYVMGILLMAAPWLLQFAENGPETWVPVAVGGAVVLYSLFTDYELGAVRVLPMPMHLLLDALGGIFLAASPWLFQFSDQVWIPHLVLGLAELGAAAMTERQPRFDRLTQHPTAT